jgi:hypothetical protein
MKGHSADAINLRWQRDVRESCLKRFLSAPPSHRAGQSNPVFSYQIVNGLAINTMCICVYVYVYDECTSLSQWTKAPETQGKGGEL